MCGLLEDAENAKDSHRELSPAEIARGEVAVSRVKGAIDGYINPFEIDDKEKLYVLSSGSAVSPEIEEQT